MNALFRARESARPAAERVLHDPWAAHLAERDPRVFAVRFGRFFAPPLRAMIDELQTAHSVRHRTIDELVLRMVRGHGYRQVVVLGAGYDMRRSRFAAELEAHGLERWVELDRPEMIAEKRARLARARSIEPPRAVEAVAHDLLHGSLGDALAPLGLDRGPTLFVLEGVVHYLTRGALEGVFDAIRRAGPRTAVVLSFIRSDEYERAPGLFVELVKLVREIPRLHFTLDTLDALARRHEMVRHGAWTLADQVESFAPEARGRRLGLGQDVALLGGQVL